MNEPMTKDYIRCNVCGSLENKFLFNAKDRLHGIEGSFSYVRCTRCGLVYMNPQISFEDVQIFYPEDYAPHKSQSDKNIHTRCSTSRFKKSYLAEPFFQKLNENSCFLDVGCGNGKFLNEVRSFFGCKVYGVDISKKAAETSKSNYDLDIFTGEITKHFSA